MVFRDFANSRIANRFVDLVEEPLNFAGRLNARAFERPEVRRALNAVFPVTQPTASRLTGQSPEPMAVQEFIGTQLHDALIHNLTDPPEWVQPASISPLERDLNKLKFFEEAGTSGRFNEFLNEIGATPQEFAQFRMTDSVEADLMFVQSQLRLLGSSTILPGNTRKEQLDAGLFRLKRLTGTAPSTGVSRAEIQTRAAHNPAVAIDMAGTIAGAGFLPGEAVSSLALGQGARLTAKAIGLDEEAQRQAEHIGTFVGMFVAGAPRNPARTLTYLDDLHNIRKARGLTTNLGADFYFEEARDLLRLSKGMYKIGGSTLNALSGISQDVTQKAARKLFIPMDGSTKRVPESKVYQELRREINHRIRERYKSDGKNIKDFDPKNNNDDWLLLERMSAAVGREMIPELRAAETGKPFRATLFRGYGREDKAESIIKPQAGGEAFNSLSDGTYATTNVRFAKGFGPELEQLEIRLNNPLVIETDGQMAELMLRATGRKSPYGPENAGEAAALQHVIKEMGHDGVVVKTAVGDEIWGIDGRPLTPEEAGRYLQEVNADPLRNLLPSLRGEGPILKRLSDEVSAARNELDDAIADRDLRDLEPSRYYKVVDNATKRWEVAKSRFFEAKDAADLNPLNNNPLLGNAGATAFEIQKFHELGLTPLSTKSIRQFFGGDTVVDFSSQRPDVINRKIRNPNLEDGISNLHAEEAADKAWTVTLRRLDKEEAEKKILQARKAGEHSVAESLELIEQYKREMEIEQRRLSRPIPEPNEAVENLILHWVLAIEGPRGYPRRGDPAGKTQRKLYRLDPKSKVPKEDIDELKKAILERGVDEKSLEDALNKGGDQLWFEMVKEFGREHANEIYPADRPVVEWLPDAIKVRMDIRRARLNPDSPEEFARKHPEIPSSEIDNAIDDIHVDTAGARAADPTKIPPRNPGDPIGYSNGKNTSGPDHVTPWQALFDGFEVPTWETISQTVIRLWEGARNREAIIIQGWFDDLTEFAKNPVWYRKRIDALKKSGEPDANMHTLRMAGIRAPDRKEWVWDKESALPIYRALHDHDGNRSEKDTWKALSDEQRYIAEAVLEQKIIEENNHFQFLQAAVERDADLWRFDLENFSRQMIAHPSYFPRGWRSKIHPNKTFGEVDYMAEQRELATLADKAGRGLSSQPAFTRERNKYSFDEMINFGYEPSTWNPIAMMAQRTISGNELREMTVLVDRLMKNKQAIAAGRPQTLTGTSRETGELVDSEVTFTAPPQGWAEPNHPIFRGREQMDITDPKTGKVKILQSRPAIFVRKEVSNWLDATFNRSEEWGNLNKWGNRAKITKLLMSAFQHIDIVGRAIGASFTPLNNLAYLSGKRGSRIPPFIRVPSLFMDVMRAQATKGYRENARQALITDKPINKKALGNLSWKDVVDAGWETRGDLTLIRRELNNYTDSLEGTINKLTSENQSWELRSVGAAAKGIAKLNDWWQSGLFEGVYLSSQKWALEHFILPTIKAQNPTWSDKMVASQAAENVNIMFSSLGTWQTVLRHANPAIRNGLTAAIFSTNETESLARAAMRSVPFSRVAHWERAGKATYTAQDRTIPDMWGRFTTGARGARKAGIPIKGTDYRVVNSEHFRVFAEWHLGMYAWMAILSTMLHRAATGEWLPAEAYNPVEGFSPYSAFGPGYRTSFLSPELPFLTGRNNQPINADLVGQMDTAFRWGTHPLNAAAARLNVLPSAVINQIAGSTFTGVDMETLPERGIQLGLDIAGPISAINGINALRNNIPALANYTLPAETRIGTTGALIQVSGLNVRADDNRELRKRLGVVGDKEQAELREEFGKWAGVDQVLPTFTQAQQSILAGRDQFGNERSIFPKSKILELNRSALDVVRSRLERFEQIDPEALNQVKELTMRDVEKAINEGGTKGTGKSWHHISIQDVLIAWDLFADKPRTRKALLNKARDGGYGHLLEPFENTKTAPGATKALQNSETGTTNRNLFAPLTAPTRTPE
tara:strand:- start:13596 stop:19538 length:5943 start_codon:yes stop_codon:yes gene_type:complete